MAYEQKDNAGSLFRNDKKEAETHADYRGSAKVAGVEYFLDAWINTDRNGNKYMSLKLKPKDQQGGGQQPARQAAPVSQFDDDSEVPF